MRRKRQRRFFRKSLFPCFHSYSFSVHLQKQDEKYILAVIQQSSFMTFPLLIIPFRRATELEMNRYLVCLITKLQNMVIYTSIFLSARKLCQSAENPFLSNTKNYRNGIRKILQLFSNNNLKPCQFFQKPTSHKSLHWKNRFGCLNWSKYPLCKNVKRRGMSN